MVVVAVGTYIDDSVLNSISSNYSTKYNVHSVEDLAHIQQEVVGVIRGGEARSLGH